jgi:hypothetical protein
MGDAAAVVESPQTSPSPLAGTLPGGGDVAVGVSADALPFLAPRTFSASRFAAASSPFFFSSGLSFSASRAAYAASRSISAMTICLMLTLGCRPAVAERNGPRVCRWKSSVKTWMPSPDI